MQKLESGGVSSLTAPAGSAVDVHVFFPASGVTRTESVVVTRGEVTDVVFD